MASVYNFTFDNLTRTGNDRFLLVSQKKKYKITIIGSLHMFKVIFLKNCGMNQPIRFCYKSTKCFL